MRSLPPQGLVGRTPSRRRLPIDALSMTIGSTSRFDEAARPVLQAVLQATGETLPSGAVSEKRSATVSIDETAFGGPAQAAPVLDRQGKASTAPVVRHRARHS